MREYDLTTITWRRPVFILTYGIFGFMMEDTRDKEILRVNNKNRYDLLKACCQPTC